MVRLRDNILQAFHRLGADELLEGMNWYAAANERISLVIARKFKLKMPAAIGVVAALSPGCSWTQNLTDAAWLAETPTINLPLTSYKSNVRKALAILNGEAPEEVLCGNKVRAFYHNLLHPRSSPHVTIDRHAVRVAMARNVGSSEGSRMLDRVGVYDRFVEAYTLAADNVGILGLQMQAATWIHYRNQNGIKV